MHTLEARRAELCISKSELARRCGLNQASVSDVMNGRTLPNARQLQLIADALGVDLGEYVTPWHALMIEAR